MPDIKVLVEGGKATAGAPLGPALGPTGVNIGAVVAMINEKTAGFAGTKVPVKISVDSAKKTFEIEVGSPSMSALIKQELKLEKGSGNPKANLVGNLSLAQVKKIAEMKIESINSTDLFHAAREVIGTVNSMGVTIEGKHAKEIQKEFAQGLHDAFFEFKRESREEKHSLAHDLSEKIHHVVDEITHHKSPQQEKK